MNDLSVNPLLDLDEQGRSNAASAGRAGAASGLPHFSAIRAEHVEPAVDTTLAANRAAIERLYRAYKAVAARPDYASLTAAQQKIIDNILRDFRLSGAELNETDKKRFKEIEQPLSTLQSKFEANVPDRKSV